MSARSAGHLPVIGDAAQHLGQFALLIRYERLEERALHDTDGRGDLIDSSAQR